MNLEKMAFEFIAKLIDEGNYKEASLNIWHIAKSNRMRNLTKEMKSSYNYAVQIEIYKNADAVDEIFAKIQEGRIKHDLDIALATLRRKEDLIIDYPKTMKFGFHLNEKTLSKKEKELAYQRISTIKNLGFDVTVNKAD